MYSYILDKDYNIVCRTDRIVDEVDGSFIMKGEAELVDVSDALDIEFPDEDIDTLNGFLLYKLGHLPKDDEEIEILHGDYLFVPAKIKDNMIRLVKVKRVDNR